jgi:hypothetical protein
MTPANAMTMSERAVAVLVTAITIAYECKERCEIGITKV